MVIGYRMKKVILTGGTGMIGHALIECLLCKNIEVTLLVRRNSNRIRLLPHDKRIMIVECDLSQMTNINLPDDKYDAFFHLGWAGTYGDARNDMYLQNRNILYTLDAVNLAHRLGCKVFVGAGSQAEYGRVYEEKLTPFTPVVPENGYGIAKLCAGQMSRVMAQNYGMRHVWFRILSVYGCYDGEQTLIMSSIIKMSAGKSPEYTLAEQRWDYLYCEDAAEALYLGAQKGVDGAVYCLGSGQIRKLREYIEIIRDAINPSIELRFGERPYADKQVMYLCADISNLYTDTGFEPKYSFYDGIQKTLEWYRGRINEKN